VVHAYLLPHGLPGAISPQYHLRPVFPDQGMIEQLQELGSVEGGSLADDILDLPDGYLSQGVVMGYSHHSCIRSYGPVQVEGMGHHDLIPGKARLKKSCFDLAHAAGGEGSRAVFCNGNRRAE